MASDSSPLSGRTVQVVTLSPPDPTSAHRLPVGLRVGADLRLSALTDGEIAAAWKSRFEKNQMDADLLLLGSDAWHEARKV